MNPDFNPRTHGECDLVKCNYPFFDLKISIHAPVRGATGQEKRTCKDYNNFNPRTHEGCDQPFSNGSQKFADFNPLTREGCDVFLADDYFDKVAISIHAPVKGATVTLVKKRKETKISIHALTRSATVDNLSFRVNIAISIHALTGSAP